MAGNADPLTLPRDWEKAQAAMRAVMPSFGNKFIPALHLQRFASTLSPKVAVMGDSTSWDQGNNTAGLIDNLWGFLRTRMREDNPGRTITFGNYAIGGSTIFQYNRTGVQITSDGLTLPSWFSPTSSTWISFVQAFAPDLLFVNWGVNDSYTFTTNSLNSFLSDVAAWTKIPDIVLITPKSANPVAAGAYRLRNYQAGYLNAAGLQRTTAAANSASYTAAATLPNLGLLDVGRAFEIMVKGRDPVVQDLLSVLEDVEGIDAFPYDFEGTDGDMFLDITFPGMGAAFEAAGTVVTVKFGDPQGSTAGSSFITFSTTNGTTFFANMYGGGGLSVTSANLNNWSSGDLHIQIHLAGPRLYVTTQGSVVHDLLRPRYAGPFVPRITLTNPPASPLMTVNAYYRSRMRPTLPGLSRAEAFGPRHGTGNGINHGTSLQLNRVDRWFLQNTSFHCPVKPAASGRVVTAAGGITVGRDDHIVVVKKASGAATAVTLPTAPFAFRPYTIIDGKGDAASNNITTSPASGTIAGSATHVISSNYGRVTFIHDGTTWLIQG